MLRRLAVLVVPSLIVSLALAQAAPPTTTPSTPTRQREGARERPPQRPDAAKGQTTVVDVAASADNFKTLVSLLEAAGLVSTLKGAGPFTVFAPTDDAFAKLPSGTLDELRKPENKERLATILKYHVVSGRSSAADLAKAPTATTLAGQRLNVAAKDGAVTVDGAAVTKADIACSNGVIHAVNAVLMPIDGDVTQVGLGLGTINIYLSAMDAAGMRDMFKGPDPFTLFAPSDDAFRKLPKGTLENLMKAENRTALAMLLGRHVVPGQRLYADGLASMREVQTIGGSPIKVGVRDGKLMVGDATVSVTDMEARNGVIFVIDTVLMAPAGQSTAGAESSKQ